MKRNERKIKSFQLIIGSILGIVLLATGLIFAALQTNGLSIVKGLEAAKILKLTSPTQQAIHPTIYVTSSNGAVSQPEGMIEKLAPLTVSAQAKPSLQISVDIAHNNKISVKGKITADNLYPMIAFGTVKGTIQGEKYAKALKVAVRYLTAHYKVSAINFMGFSSGGTGVMAYLEDYGKETQLPKVDKVAMLDPEFNTKKPLAPKQNLGMLLLDGPLPQMQTPMYHELSKMTNLDPKVQFVLMESEYKASHQTDGVLPYADAFSLYHLLLKHGNPTVIHLYPSSTSHNGLLLINTNAVNFINTYFYSKN